MLLLFCRVDNKKNYGKIIFDRKHWEKFQLTFIFFIKCRFVWPELLDFRPITFCAKFDKVLLEQTYVKYVEHGSITTVK